MSSIVDRDAAMRVLRASVPRIEKLTLEDTKDPKRVVRTINALIELVSKVAENDALPYIDFEDGSCGTGSTAACACSRSPGPARPRQA
jgi:pyridoxal biosynthesis lyase PdxS